MTGLVDAEPSTSWQGDLSHQAVSLVLHRIARNTHISHLGDKSLDVVAHEVELVHVVLLGRVNGEFGRRQSEDEPASAHIDVAEPQDVAQKGAVCIRLGAVDDGVSTDDHDDFSRSGCGDRVGLIPISVNAVQRAFCLANPCAVGERWIFSERKSLENCSQQVLMSDSAASSAPGQTAVRVNRRSRLIFKRVFQLSSLFFLIKGLAWLALAWWAL